jgi:hypothetical protein
LAADLDVGGLKIRDVATEAEVVAHAVNLAHDGEAHALMKSALHTTMGSCAR